MHLQHNTYAINYKYLLTSAIYNTSVKLSKKITVSTLSTEKFFFFSYELSDKSLLYT